MDTKAAYFSNQTFRIGSKEVKVRIYYAGAAPFKEALANWTLQPSTYENRDEGKTWYNITPKAK